MAEATAARPRRAAVRGAKPRRAAPPSIPRLPVQVVTMIGLSGGCYALSLALVAGLQSDADATVAAARAPFASGVASIVERNDHLARGLAGLTDLDGQAAEANASVVAAITEVETRLGRLSAAVAAVDGAAQHLPARAPMPALRSVSVARTARHAHATTGGSAVP